MEKQIEIIINQQAQAFCFSFLTELNDLKHTLRGLSINISESLPKVFKNGNLKIDFFYSKDRDNVFIAFNKLPIPLSSDKSALYIHFIDGNVFGPLGNPVNFYNGQITFVDCSLNNFNVGYGLAITYQELLKRAQNIKSYVSDFASFYWIESKSKSRPNLLEYLFWVKHEMERLFFDETVGELEIDSFLEKNPIILQRTLHLVPVNHQATLKNILNKYEHDLKPDLLAFDELEKTWVIVDYKKAKRNIIKNVGKVRTGFKAEVHALKDQLRDYREYFFEREHRDYIKKEYNILIEYPRSIGIIGNVFEEEQRDFNRLIADEPNWFKVIPYNYLYDDFVRYVDLAHEHLK